jgi:hypothetical protein
VVSARVFFRSSPTSAREGRQTQYGKTFEASFHSLERAFGTHLMLQSSYCGFPGGNTH